MAELVQESVARALPHPGSRPQPSKQGLQPNALGVERTVLGILPVVMEALLALPR